jgi:hypothetical protein
MTQFSFICYCVDINPLKDVPGLTEDMQKIAQQLFYESRNLKTWERALSYSLFQERRIIQNGILAVYSGDIPEHIQEAVSLPKILLPVGQNHLFETNKYKEPYSEVRFAVRTILSRMGLTENVQESLSPPMELFYNINGLNYFNFCCQMREQILSLI